MVMAAEIDLSAAGEAAGAGEAALAGKLERVICVFAKYQRRYSK
jgi:hypothetical protein